MSPQHNEGMKNMRYTTVEEIKPHLQLDDYKFITKMLKGKYKLRTVEAQLRGDRTLKQPVVEAANKLIQSREDLLK